jgi:hypothetical protein
MTDPKDVWRCKTCGSQNVLTLAWVDPNHPSDAVVDLRPHVGQLDLSVSECQNCGGLVEIGFGGAAPEFLAGFDTEAEANAFRDGILWTDDKTIRNIVVVKGSGEPGRAFEVRAIDDTMYDNKGLRLKEE